jgi:hypothetical protein
MIVRVAFQDRNAPYVIPFGYAYHDGRLYGVTAPGRKTVIAEQNPRVGFQVDSSARTGPWEWRSVTGDGDFELVDDERERAAALAALEPLNARAPEWWQDEIRPLMASGNARVWRLTPDRISGVEYARPG